MASVMQPRFGEQDFPIGRLVLDRAKGLHLSRTDLVRRFGYEKLNTGHRDLTELLTTGTPSSIIAPKLAEALEADPDLIASVLLSTERQQHDEARARVLEKERAYRASFRPHLQVPTERAIPSPIFVAALVGVAKLRTMPLPDEMFSGDEDTGDRIVKAAILEHYREYGGRLPAFGRICGYVLVLLAGYGGLDFGLPFCVKGDRAGPMRPVRRLPEALLGKRRADGRLSGLLRGSPVQVTDA